MVALPYPITSDVVAPPLPTAENSVAALGSNVCVQTSPDDQSASFEWCAMSTQIDDDSLCSTSYVTTADEPSSRLKRT